MNGGKMKYMSCLLPFPAKMELHLPLSFLISVTVMEVKIWYIRLVFYA